MTGGLACFPCALEKDCWTCIPPQSVEIWYRTSNRKFPSGREISKQTGKTETGLAHLEMGLAADEIG